MSGRFVPGQVITIFRSRLRSDAAPGYHETAEEILALARRQPGFVDYKAFAAEDGERVSLVTFADADSQRAWATDVEHRAAQPRGRDEWYAANSIQVGTTMRAIEHLFV